MIINLISDYETQIEQNYMILDINNKTLNIQIKDLKDIIKQLNEFKM